ncbi:hypothetical protein BDU57DRAFT_592196 [Ampelomyces quisqualis]|uniref:Uncharacterized protein n=1 Tax=Ampelomyces quisqualis TaxID=50730 RepID=A0A6A5R1S8_AMPQU|nr:hypothetical protein BDU57DRAFT_592196 [Ampelomyces quisqualis]
MANKDYWPAIPGAFSSYREDGTSDTGSSDTESVGQEAPRGPGSPMQPPLPNLDDPVKALVEAFDIKDLKDFHYARKFVYEETNAFKNEVEAALQKAAAVNYGKNNTTFASQAQSSDSSGISPVTKETNHRAPTASTFSFRTNHKQAPSQPPKVSETPPSLFNTAALSALPGTGLFGNVPVGVSQGSLFGKGPSGEPSRPLFGINPVNQLQGSLFDSNRAYPLQTPLFESNSNHQSRGPLFGTDTANRLPGSVFETTSTFESRGSKPGQSPNTGVQDLVLRTASQIDASPRSLFGNTPVDTSQNPDQSKALDEAAMFEMRKCLFRPNPTEIFERPLAKPHSLGSQGQYPSVRPVSTSPASTSISVTDLLARRSKGTTFEYTWNGDESSGSSILELFQQLLPFRDRIGDDMKKYKETHGTLSGLRIDGLEISSPGEFIKAVKPSFLKLQSKPGEPSYVLSMLYKNIINFADDVMSMTTENLAYKMDILRIEEMARNSSCSPTVLHELNDAKELTKRHLGETEAGFNQLQNYFISHIIEALLMISEHTESDSPNSASPNFAQQQSLERRLQAELKATRLELIDAHSESQMLQKEIERLQDTCDAAKKYMADKVKELHSTHRSQISTRLSECTRDHEDALRKLKERYRDRINDAEAKVRLYKKVTVRNGKLEMTIKKLEDEKSEMLLAKAAVEKKLQDLEAESRVWLSYKDAYEQIKAENEQLQGDYNDVVTERDELRNPSDVSTNQNMIGNVRETSALHAAGGTLQSYDQDLEFLETYWSRQEQFAEVAVRDTAAEIEDLDAQINEITRQLNALKAPDDPSSEDEEENETDDTTAVTAAGETEIEPSAPEDVDHSQLLDTLVSPLPREDSRSQAPYPIPTAPRGMRRTIWADKAAKVPDGRERMGHAFAQLSYQGHGVSTIKETSRMNTGATQGEIDYRIRFNQAMTGLDGRVDRRLDKSQDQTGPM